MLITESGLREKFSKLEEPPKEFVLPAGAIITPAAREYLMDRRIAITAAGRSRGAGRCRDLAGKEYEKKPEWMTHLNGTLLVPKDHPRIELRGRLDSLQSSILEAQLTAASCGDEPLISELGEVLSFVRELVRAEVMEAPIRVSEINGRSLDEIHARSHDPKKYYGMPHLMASFEMGARAIALNALRTQVREAEISAFRAFADDAGNVERGDILTALNRLSSCFYIMIFEHLPENYKASPSGI